MIYAEEESEHQRGMAIMISQVAKKSLIAGADTGGVDRVDIHPPFFSKKNNSKCHFI